MTRWYSEKKREHYYKEAKKTGYRARSAFKLKQINNKFKILKPGDYVLDLGAAPGGWSQVAKEIIDEQGKIVGIDLLFIQPINGIIFLKSDMTRDETISEIRQILGKEKIDSVISDMSPDISGNYDVDQARSTYLCTKAFETAKIFLKNNGSFVCKIFEGSDLKDFIEKLKPYFTSVNRFHPKASRKSSSEIYIISKGFKANTDNND